MAPVVVLNGGSSSGKTSIARCLQRLPGPTWLILGVDDLVRALPDEGWFSAFRALSAVGDAYLPDQGEDDAPGWYPRLGGPGISARPR
jgi:chloramphenicol 3-O-phosphotransferase